MGLKMWTSISVALLIYLISPAFGLTCLSCDTPDGTEPADPSCNELAYCRPGTAEFLTFISKTYFPKEKLLDYSIRRNIPEPVCYTIFSYDHEGMMSDGRSCSPLEENKTCVVLKAMLKDMGHTRVNCTVCRTDNCNNHVINKTMKHMPNMMSNLSRSQVLETTNSPQTVAPVTEEERTSTSFDVDISGRSGEDLKSYPVVKNAVPQVLSSFLLMVITLTLYIFKSEVLIQNYQ